MADKYLNYTGLQSLVNKIKGIISKDYSKTLSRGEQLVTNGSAIIGDNTNFSSWVYDGIEAYNSSGSFTRSRSTEYIMLHTDEYFPVDPTNTYKLSVAAKSLNGLAKIYTMPIFYDADKIAILAYHHMYRPGTLTTLSQELKNGDTVIYFSDLSNWDVNTTGYDYRKGCIFWNYRNSYGYVYPENTYSRNIWNKFYTNDSDVNKTNNTITLSSPWTHGTFPAGTKVSQCDSAANYKYRAWNNDTVLSEWSVRSGLIGDVDYSGKNVTDKFPPGVAYCRIGFLWNNNRADDQIWATNVSFGKIQTSVDSAINALHVSGNAGAGNANRHVWFSDSNTETARVYDNDFVYNPSTNVLTVGSITGSAAKVNNHTVDSNVPANALFTDTVTTATTTGSGNAVTAITASNGALTVTKGTTFLTSHQDISGKADKSEVGDFQDVIDGTPIVDSDTITEAIVELWETVNGRVEDLEGMSVSTTGSGNAVTAVTLSNGTFTVTKGATYMTSAQVQTMIDTAIANITDGNEVSY